MKRTLLIGFSICLAIVGLFIGITLLSIRSENATLRSAREKVHAMIDIGQNLGEAETYLRDQGYKLYHDEPCRPTIAEDYIQQLVIIGDTSPSGLDTFFYALTGGANPLRKESPYVVIEAKNDGIIYRID